MGSGAEPLAQSTPERERRASTRHSLSAERARARARNGVDPGARTISCWDTLAPNIPLYCNECDNRLDVALFASQSSSPSAWLGEKNAHEGQSGLKIPVLRSVAFEVGSFRMRVALAQSALASLENRFSESANGGGGARSPPRDAAGAEGVRLHYPVYHGSMQRLPAVHGIGLCLANTNAQQLSQQ